VRALNLATLAVTTLAGGAAGAATTCGFADSATGGSARFNNPRGVALAGTTLYVGDDLNCRIRTVSTVAPYATATLAGSGTCANVDGQGTNAQLFNPRGVVVDPVSGGLYVAQGGGAGQIRTVSLAGAVGTLVGFASATAAVAGGVDGACIAANVGPSTGLAISARGDKLYVANTANNKVRVVTLGLTPTAAASASPAVSSTSTISPTATATQIPRRCTVSRLAGSGAIAELDGTGTNAAFNWPLTAAVLANGNVVVASLNTPALRLVTPAGVATTLFSPGSGVIAGIAFVGNSIYFGYSNTIQMYAGGAVSRVAGTVGVCGTADGLAGPSGSGPATVCAIEAMEYSAVAGLIYFASGLGATACKVRALNPTTTAVSTLAGGASCGTVDNAAGTSALLDKMHGLALSADSSTLFITELNRVRTMSLSGTNAVATFAGSGAYAHVDGWGTAASIAAPRGIALDTMTGNFFVVEEGQTIRSLSRTGYMGTLVGIYGAGGTTDGACTAARFSAPAGLAIAAGGTMMYVTDQTGYNIRVVNMTAL
jgi:sugar lactone lactonase YvrE